LPLLILKGGRVFPLSPSPDRCGGSRTIPLDAFPANRYNGKNEIFLGEGRSSMDPTVLRYIVCIVAAIILIWAAFELRSRRVRRKKQDQRALGAWVKLDSTNAHLTEEGSLPLPDEKQEEQEEEQTDGSDMHARAQQNGHYIPSKKTL
jgi:hypothetical protein